MGLKSPSLRVWLIAMETLPLLMARKLASLPKVAMFTLKQTMGRFMVAAVLLLDLVR
jgi:hypothetical protein